MVRYIVKNIWRQTDKLALLIIGALVISSGLSVLVGLSETNRGTIINTLEEKWKTSYDIVVRPSVIEEENSNDLLDPNFLSGLSGGISIEEWEKIKAIEGVSVAAPISMVGYASYQTKFQEVFLKEPGVYKVISSISESDGIKHYKRDYTSFYTVYYKVPNEYHEFGLLNYQKENGIALDSLSTVLIAAIDPEEEKQLVGLDQAVINDGVSAYLKSDAPVSTRFYPEIGYEKIYLPILLSNQSYANQSYTYTVSKLNLNFQNEAKAEKTIQNIVENGGEKYLEAVDTLDKQTYKFTSKDHHKQLMENISFGNSEGIESLESILQEKPSPILYREVESPFENQWSLAYEIKTEKDVTDEFLTHYNLYRSPQIYGKDINEVPVIAPNLVGFYDPSKLKLSIDPTNELPMETYRLPTAKYVLDDRGNPVNPPKSVIATSNPFGYIMQPPVMLTTINGAKEILGEKPISAIRIKVEGVSQISDSSQNKLETVAEKIEAETGLKAEITLGSSPQPVLIHVPETNQEPDLGWMEQPWIKKGTTINIFNETKLGYTGLVVCLIIVAVMYVFAVNLVSYLSRKKEFAILKALGWKTTKIQSLMIVESLFVGFMVALFTMMVLMIIRSYNPGTLPLYKLLIILGSILFIYLLGALLPSLFAKKIQPVEVMKEGEISLSKARIVPVKGLISIEVNAIFSRWLRNLLTIVTIGLPSGLLIVFITVSLRLNGVLFTTWLGQYVSIEVKAPHYFSVALCFLIAILTTSEVMWQNIKERNVEISLYKALGWQDLTIRKMIYIEGGLIGFLGGILGVVFSIVTLHFMYQAIEWNELWVFVTGLIVPVFVGVISAAIPGRKIININPSMGLKQR